MGKNKKEKAICFPITYRFFTAYQLEFSQKELDGLLKVKMTKLQIKFGVASCVNQQICGEGDENKMTNGNFMSI